MTATATRRSRPVGYAEWKPRGATQETLTAITAVLDDHRAHWPITPRQILYRLIGRGQASKDDAERIGEYIVRGRRAGMIPWEAIGDGRTESAFPRCYADPDAFLDEVAEQAAGYRLDRQDGQSVHIEVVVEAAGAVEQVFRTTGTYGVGVLSGSGFSSITSLHDAVLRADDRDVPTIILTAGDLDPAGWDIRARVDADISAFAERHEVPITTRTIALTEGQVDELDLIKAPISAKKAKKHPRWPHAWTVELEALTPDQLATIVQTAIEGLLDSYSRHATWWPE